MGESGIIRTTTTKETKTREDGEAVAGGVASEPGVPVLSRNERCGEEKDERGSRELKTSTVKKRKRQKEHMTRAADGSERGRGARATPKGTAEAKPKGSRACPEDAQNRVGRLKKQRIGRKERGGHPKSLAKSLLREKTPTRRGERDGTSQQTKRKGDRGRKVLIDGVQRGKRCDCG